MRFSGWHVWVFVFTVGICVALVSGFVENRPGSVSVYGHYYGFPFIWRITEQAAGESYRLLDFTVDCTFWIVALTFLILMSRPIRRGYGKTEHTPEKTVSDD